MEPLPQIYKKTDRCSGVNDPIIGERHMFSHALQLTIDEFVPQKKLFERKEIHQGTRCVVIGRINNIVIVKFDHSDQEDLVSPEFLIPLELTSFGKELLATDPELLATVETLTCKE